MGDRPLLYLIAFLPEAGIPVYPVNPKTINGLRKVAGAKTDQIDAPMPGKNWFLQPFGPALIGTG